MSGPSETTQYLEAIQTYFLEMTGRGIVLSSRDHGLLLDWQAQGATVATVCQGIDRAVAELRTPRDIWACRKHIEPFIERVRQRSVGKAPSSQLVEGPESSVPDRHGEDVEDSQVQRLLNAIASTDRLAFQDAYRLAIAHLPPNPDFDVLRQVDALLVEAFYDSLDDPEKAEIEAFVTRGVDLKSMPEKARDEHVRVRRRRILVTKFGLVSVLD